ncbi:MAG: hypothetical protein ACQEWV_30210 [Bacillota bacterium]
MKNRNFIILGTVLTFIGFFIFFYYQPFNEPVETEDYNAKALKGIEQFSETLDKAILFAEIGHRLHEKGYEFGMEYDVLSEKNIEVIIKLPNKQVVEENDNEIKQVVNRVIDENSFDLDVFNVQVKTYTESD